MTDKDIIFSIFKPMDILGYLRIFHFLFSVFRMVNTMMDELPEEQRMIHDPDMVLTQNG